MTATPPAFLRRMFGLEQDRDGSSPLLEQQAVGATATPGPDGVPLPGLASAPRRRPLPQSPQQLLQDALAARMLHAWLQNRHQTLFPLALNLRNLPGAQRDLLVQSMVASAAMAGGSTAPLESLLPRLGGDAEAARTLATALAQPPSVAPLLQALHRAGLGAHAYNVALLVGAGGGRLGQAWLDYLAACFELPVQVTRDLQRRSGRRHGRSP